MIQTGKVNSLLTVTTWTAFQSQTIYQDNVTENRIYGIYDTSQIIQVLGQRQNLKTWTQPFK